jgi:NAD(P)-dependent dehydrogenase (short-subunit alcohol dehydrogenase family)
MMEWRDQVAVVTGGARGLGRATAWLLAQRGAAVCVNYAAHGDAAEALIAEIAAAGGRAIAVAADVAEVAAVEAMVGRTETELGPVTILVNNAGVAWQGTLDSYDREQVARMRQVNVEGMIHATRAVMGGMRARRYGRNCDANAPPITPAAMPAPIHQPKLSSQRDDTGPFRPESSFRSATNPLDTIAPDTRAKRSGPHGARCSIGPTQNPQLRSSMVNRFPRIYF